MTTFRTEYSGGTNCLWFLIIFYYLDCTNCKFPEFSPYSFFSLTFNEIPWLFPSLEFPWLFPDRWTPCYNLEITVTSLRGQWVSHGTYMCEWVLLRQAWWEWRDPQISWKGEKSVRKQNSLNSFSGTYQTLWLMHWSSFPFCTFQQIGLKLKKWVIKK